MRIQSSHPQGARGLDAYFTPVEAVLALLDKEPSIPKRVLEPAAGNGSIVRPLQAAGFDVVAQDICDYGLPGCTIADYLATPTLPMGPFDAVITNPPFKLAEQFARKAIREVPYTALLLRTNFVESVSRLPFFRCSPPTRIWVSSRRLPMMHRFGWDGPTATSNTCYAWFIWDRRYALAESGGSHVDWFDWLESVDRVRGQFVPCSRRLAKNRPGGGRPTTPPAWPSTSPTSARRRPPERWLRIRPASRLR
jgi:hypothetical protein